jgi:membrane dipeptidase
MMVDISHISWKSMRDVVGITKAPLFASHSAVASKCNVTRNIPDDVLLAMKDLDGVVMVKHF